MKKPNINEAVHAAVAAIYFADDSDYQSALWEVIEHLDPKIHKLLSEDESAAYNLSAKRIENKDS